MTYYKLPLHAGQLINGKVHPRVSKERSILECLNLILQTKWPEECPAIKNFGCSARKFTHASPGRKKEEEFFREIQLEIQQSMKKAVKECEPRLKYPQFAVNLVSVHTENKDYQSMIRANKPVNYFLIVRVEGQFIDSGRSERFRHEFRIPLG